MKKIILLALLTSSLTGFSKKPLDFIDVSNLSVMRQDGKVLIQWLRAETSDIAMYELERSHDGRNFTTIAYIASSNDVKNYSYKDKNATTNTYYRLKQVDISGKAYYTCVQVLKGNKENEVKIAATTNGKVYIQFPKQVKENMVVRLTSLTGEVIAEYPYSQPSKEITINAPAQTKTFVVTVKSTLDLNISKQIVL